MRSYPAGRFAGQDEYASFDKEYIILHLRILAIPQPDARHSEHPAVCQIPCRGAQVLLVCSSWVLGTYKTQQWLPSARGSRTACTWLASAKPDRSRLGRSVLVDPMGFLESDLGLEPGGGRWRSRSLQLARVKESFPMFRLHHHGRQPAGGVEAAGLLATVAVKGRAAKTGYERTLFGPTWADVDRHAARPATTSSAGT